MQEAQAHRMSATAHPWYEYFVLESVVGEDGSTTEKTHRRDIVGWDESGEPLVIHPDGRRGTVKAWLRQLDRATRVEHGARRSFHTKWEYLEVHETPSPMIRELEKSTPVPRNPLFDR